MLCAATHGLPAAPKTSQGLVVVVPVPDPVGDPVPVPVLLPAPVVPAVPEPVAELDAAVLLELAELSLDDVNEPHAAATAPSHARDSGSKRIFFIAASRGGW